MYNFFKNIAEQNSCNLIGACSIHPSINALYQIILNEIREISFYLVKLKEFKITDEGVPFDPLNKVDPDISLSAEDRKIGGLGIFITKKTMDDVTYTYEDNKNILVMIKKI